MVRCVEPHVIPGDIIIPPQDLVGRIIKVKWEDCGMQFDINELPNDKEDIKLELINKTFLKETKKLFSALEILSRCKNAFCPYIIEVRENGYHIISYQDGETGLMKEDDFVLDKRRIEMAGVSIG